MSKRVIQTIRWIARIWASLMVAFMLFMFGAHIIDDGIGPLDIFDIRDALMMLALITSLTGLAVGWKNERLGGWMAVGGMAAFFLINFFFTGAFPVMVTFLIIAFPGLLFLLLSYFDKESGRQV